MPFVPNVMPGPARLAGIAAIGLSSLAFNARAQTPTATPGLLQSQIYAPPPPSSSVYRPGPGIISSTASSAHSNVTGVVAERDTRNDNRWITFAFFAGVVTLFGVAVFRLLNKHNQEEEEKAKKDRGV